MLLDASADRRVKLLSLCDEATAGFIAHEIALHFEEMTGRKHDAPRRVADLCGEQAPAVVLEIVPALGREAHACAVEDGFVRIRGGDARGLYYGALALFEHFGFRWFAPGADGTVIPHLDSVELPDSWQISGKPSLVWRGYHICGTGQTRDGAPIGHFDHETALWMARNRMNFKPIHNDEYEEAVPLLEELLLSPLAFGHSYSHWVRPEEFERRPDFFALIAGTRQKVGQFCLSNPALREELVRRIVEYIDAHPQLPVISIAPNDGYRWCQCPGCTALDSAEDKAREEINRRNHEFSAAIAQEVGRLRPAHQISTLSYCNYLDPSDDIPRAESLAISMCITRAQNHAIDDAASASNRTVLERTERWLAKSGTVIWSCYFLSYGGTFPRPYDRQWLRTVQALVARGVKGFKSEVTPGRYDRWQSAIFHLYMVARSVWDADVDFDALREDFCRRFYGPAWRNCLEYYRVNEAAVEHFPEELTAIDAAVLPRLYSDTDMAAMREALESAARALEGAEDIYRRRLALLARQVEEIARSREAIRAAEEEAAPLQAPHFLRPPSFEDFDKLRWVMQRMRSNRLPYPCPNRVAAAWTDDALWVCFRLGEPEMAKSLDRRGLQSDIVWGNSNVDCFFSAFPESGVYYQIAANLHGHLYSARNRGRELNAAWPLKPALQVRHLADQWEMVLGIPFDHIEMPCPRPGDRMRLALNRGQMCGSPSTLGGWPNGGSWHNVKTMGEVIFCGGDS